MVNIKDDYNFIDFDIIFLLGGKTTSYLEYFTKEKLLNQLPINKDLVVVGLSAGGNMLANYGMEDINSYYNNSSYYNFNLIKGLGIIDIIFCPHFNKEGFIIFNKWIKDYNSLAISVEDEVAVFYENNEFYVIKDNNKNEAFYYLTPDFIMKAFNNNKKYKLFENTKNNN